MGIGTLEINKAKYGAKKCCELLKRPKAKKKKSKLWIFGQRENEKHEIRDSSYANTSQSLISRGGNRLE